MTSHITLHQASRSAYELLNEVPVAELVVRKGRKTVRIRVPMRLFQAMMRRAGELEYAGHPAEVDERRTDALNAIYEAMVRGHNQAIRESGDPKLTRYMVKGVA